MKKTIEENWKDLKWKEIKNNVKTFRLDDEPELIHVIKTGFKDKYLVVYEDGYESPNKVISGTKNEIENKFQIELNMKQNVTLSDLAIKSSNGDVWKKIKKRYRENKKSIEIAIKVFVRLHELGKKKTWLAKKLETSEHEVSKMLKGEYNFKIETISKLEEILGIELK